MQDDAPHRGLGALVAEKFAAEGCNVAVNYNASKDRAEQVVEKIEKEYKVKSFVIHGVGSRPALNCEENDRTLLGHGHLSRL